MGTADIRYRGISIHAPRVGSDRCRNKYKSSHQDFNPRSPCGERHSLPPVLQVLFLFQSTLPVWGATGEGTNIIGDSNISIHAPRVGSDIAVHH